MAITAGNFQFYNPGQVDPEHPFYPGSDLWNSIAENNHQGYYGYWLGQMGKMGIDPTSRAAQNLYNNFEAGYQASQFDRPDLSWVQYLNEQQGGVNNIIAGLSPEDRGIRRGQFAGGSQWLQRSS